MPKKRPEEYTGGVIDDRIPIQVERALLELTEGNRLLPLFKRAVGHFRFDIQVRDTKATRAQTIEHLQVLQEKIDGLIDHVDRIPASAQAEMHEVLYESGRPLRLFDEDLKRELFQFCALISGALRKVDAWPGSKGGETPKFYEHKLLADIALMLEEIAGLRKVEAAGVSAELLRGCGVHNVPSSSDKARAAIREINKKIRPVESQAKD